MFRETLDVKIEDGLAEVARAIEVRHHIVHRNGVDHDGAVVSVSAADVLAVFDAVGRLAVNIDKALFPKQSSECCSSFCGHKLGTGFPATVEPFPQLIEKNGSSGWIRTSNAPVNRRNKKR